MKHLYLFILIAFASYSKAQNLVPNYSFENLNTCNLPLQFNQVSNWCDYSGYQYLFNICAGFNSSPSSGGVPYSPSLMFQYPKTGNGFGGVVCYTNAGGSGLTRNGQLQAHLTQTLTPNKKYIVKFYVNLNNDAQYAIDKICALLTNTPIACNTGSFTTMLASPQIINKNGVISDTLNWVEVCDTITAIGNEQYLIIGNFFSDANTTITQPYPASREITANYNIDDVSVEEFTPANCQNDTAVCQNDSMLLGNNKTETATYNWEPITGLSCSFCANPKATPRATTKYMLTKQNCNIITKDSVTITVKIDCNPKSVEIPNVFTPNADGINDVFTFKINGTLRDFSVYNRWGVEILNDKLEMKNVAQWNGRTTSGNECSEGVYFYTLEFIDANGDAQKKNGYVSLIR
jgi:gliding motility-associated-like protein